MVTPRVRVLAAVVAVTLMLSGCTNPLEIRRESAAAQLALADISAASGIDFDIDPAVRISDEWESDELGIPRSTRVGRVEAGISPGTDPERVDRFLSELPRIAEQHGGIADFHTDLQVGGILVEEAETGDFDTAARVAAVTGDRPGELRTSRLTLREPVATGELEQIFARAPGVDVVLGRIAGLESHDYSHFYRPDPMVAGYSELNSQLRELPGVYWASVDLRFRYRDRPPGPPLAEELQTSVWVTPELVDLDLAELLKPVVFLSLDHFDSFELHLRYQDQESIRVPYIVDTDVPHNNPPELHALLDQLAGQHREQQVAEEIALESRDTP